MGTPIVGLKIHEDVDEDARGLGTNLLRPAILIYLLCGECRNEEIIHHPKDESEFLAKKKIFEANIFKFFLKGEPISKFWGATNQNTYRKFV